MAKCSKRSNQLTITRRALLLAAVAAPMAARWRLNARSGSLTAEERAAATEYLTLTRDLMLGGLRGLSETQWRFKPSTEVWSAAEILEHVIVVEDDIVKRIGREVRTGKALPPSERPAIRDRVVEMVVTNRTTRRFTAPEVFRPTNRWSTTSALTAAFLQRRRTTLEYLSGTTDDLRAYAWENPIIGLIDGYQWLLFVGGHCDRHTRQLVELRAHDAFPRVGRSTDATGHAH
jgi:hypothetical protein